MKFVRALRALGGLNPERVGAAQTVPWSQIPKTSKGMMRKEAQFYGTSIGCFILAMPNRYLPILQEGRVQSLLHPVESSSR